MARPSDDLPGIGDRPGQGPLTPEEEADVDARLEAVREEKKRALADPGLPWGEWFYYRASKWYVILVYLIVLAWEISLVTAPTDTPVYIVVPIVGATIYGQYLLYLYLWYRPKVSPRSRAHRPNAVRRWWIRPVPYGRWTPEAAEARAGRAVVVPDGGPDPREFM